MLKIMKPYDQKGYRGGKHYSEAIKTQMSI